MHLRFPDFITPHVFSFELVGLSFALTWYAVSYILGIISAAAISGIAGGAGYTERGSLQIVAWAALGIGTVLFIFLLCAVKDPSQTRHELVKKHDIRLLIKNIITNKPFIVLIFGWFLNSLANGIPAVLFILYMKFVLDAGIIERGILTFLYFLAGVVGIPIWLYLSNAMGKHRTW